MSNYPTSIDGPSSLFSPVDLFSTKPLQTTTSAPVGAGDVSISVVNANAGFAPTYGVISIDDENIVYASKTGVAFSGCIRGAFGTTAASHSNGAQVNADMVSGFLTSLQTAVVALETAVGITGAFNFVKNTGAQTIVGAWTFTNGIELGSANIATTGLVNLPNASFIAWRNAANSSDITIAVNSSNHLSVPIIDFNAGQTFPASSIQDATNAVKGVVQISSTGGLSVASGILSVTDVGSPGTYTKVTTNSRGQVTAGTALASGDIPSLSYVLGIAFTSPSQFSVSGSPITGGNSGTIALTWNTQSPNAVLAGPASGGAAAPTFRLLVAADIPALGYGFGTVTSVALAMPAIFSVVGSPIGGSGTLTVTLATQAANLVWAGPASGAASGPTFRSLVALDHGSGTANSTTFLRGDLTWAAPPGGGGGTVSSVGLAMPAQFSVAGSPVTGSSSFTVTWANQNINLVFAGPGTGSAAAPTFRSLVLADLPTLSFISSTATQTANTVLSGPATAGPTAPTFRSLVFADIPATSAATVSTVVARDASAGSTFAYVAANNLWAFQISHFQNVESGPFQTIGGPLENLAKHSEDFSSVWDTNSGSVTVVANSVVAPDGNTTADTLTPGASGLIRQQIVAPNSTYTFYVWLRAASGSPTVSIGIFDYGWTTWLVGPTAVTLSTTWQRFKVTGTLGSGTGVYIAIGHYTDTWTSGTVIYAWGACLQTGTDPMKAYVRTWDDQITSINAGSAQGSTVIVAATTSEIPLRIYGPNSPMPTKILAQVDSLGKLHFACNNSGGVVLDSVVSPAITTWGNAIKVTNEAGTLWGYLLLYT